MAYAVAKSVVALLLLGAGLAAALSMLAATGRSPAPASPGRLRTVHRAAGYLFGLFALGNGLAGFLYFLKAGDALSIRGILHVHLSLALIALVALKIALARFYRSYLRMAPALGLSIVVLTFVLVAASAGYRLLRPAAPARPAAASEEIDPASLLAGDPSIGAEAFAGLCAPCHHPDRTDSLAGPGLKGLFERNNLSDGRPVTTNLVLGQIRRPAGTMPPFADLSDRDLADLIAYLRTI